jgi:hypothetical protein
MKKNTHQNTARVMILLSILAICVSGCGPTDRHPGPLGGLGDFLQDRPGAVFVLAIIIMVIVNARKKK